MSDTRVFAIEFNMYNLFRTRSLSPSSFVSRSSAHACLLRPEHAQCEVETMAPWKSCILATGVVNPAV